MAQGANTAAAAEQTDKKRKMWPLLVFYVALAAAINSTCLLNPPVQISAGSAVSAV